MAGDWIKMRTDLYRDPKVCVMADFLLSDDGELARYVNQNMQRDIAVTRNVMRNVTVGALVSVWGVLRHRGKRVDGDLLVKGCTISVIDDVADLPGFGVAMESVGWAVETDEGIVFPRFFDEFNVDPEEDAKKKNAERQRRYRENQRQESNVTKDVTVTSESNVREEKRRDKNNTAEKPAAFCFKTALLEAGATTELAADWLAVRKTKKASNTKTALNSFLAEVGKSGHTINQALEVCCSRSWQGFNAEWVKDIKPAQPSEAIPFDRAAYDAKRKADADAAKALMRQEQAEFMRAQA